MNRRHPDMAHPVPALSVCACADPTDIVTLRERFIVTVHACPLGRPAGSVRVQPMPAKEPFDGTVYRPR